MSTTILITGATAGIGRETVRHLARLGFRVIATGRREEALREIREESPGVETVHLDVTDADSVEAARTRVDELTDGRGPDVLVNNAGYGQGGPLELVTDEELRRQYDTNVFGLMRVTRAFLPKMRERHSGRVVNVGSVAGHLALPFLGAYASTKFALEGLTDALRQELRPFGVHVVLVKPGAIRTEFGATEREGLERHADGPYRPHLERFMRWHATFHPTAPGPEHVARAVERAITDATPKDRYFAPPRNFWLVWLRKTLPMRWTDALLRRVGRLA